MAMIFGAADNCGWEATKSEAQKS